MSGASPPPYLCSGSLLRGFLVLSSWLALPPNALRSVCDVAAAARSAPAAGRRGPPAGVVHLFVALLLTAVLGPPSDLVALIVVTVLVVYFLCDPGRLWDAAVGVARAPVAAVAVLVTPTVLAVYAEEPVVWRVCLLVVCLFCVVASFDGERAMYVMDTACERVKAAVWNSAPAAFADEAARMRYGGRWAYCSPYSRRLVLKELDHFYTLQSAQSNGSAQAVERPLSEIYDFGIESCRVVAEYSRAVEDDCDAGNAFQFSNTADEMAERERSVRGGLCTHLNKLEVGLHYGEETLEGYTYFGLSDEAGSEVNGALEILRREGNVIFADFSKRCRDSGPRLAHARCYDFAELFDLLVKDKFTLRKIYLPGRYLVHVS